MDERKKSHEPVLQWAIVEGSLQPVSNYSHLSPLKRPAALCPICNRPVILKLGPERVYHIAHHPGDLCIATQPETVIHLNAKYHLQNVLKTAHSLYLTQKCIKFHSCGNTHSIEYIQGWDMVETEWPFGPYRLDVALLRQGHVIGAIEVEVFHPCEPEKTMYLNGKNICWVEIQVTPEFYTQPDAWQPSLPLSSKQYNIKHVQPWQCNECIEEYERQEREKQEKEKRLAYAKQFEAQAVRIVDLYYPTGKKYRRVYVIEKKVVQGRCITLILQEVGMQRRYIAALPLNIEGDPLSILKKMVKDELIETKKEHPDWLVDASNDWMKAPLRFHPRMFLNEYHYPYRYDDWDGEIWKRSQVNWQEMQHDTPDESSPVFSNHLIPVDQTVSEIPDIERPFDGEYICSKCGIKTNDWVTRYDAKTCLCRDCSNKETGRTGNGKTEKE